MGERGWQWVRSRQAAQARCVDDAGVEYRRWSVRGRAVVSRTVEKVSEQASAVVRRDEGRGEEARQSGVSGAETRAHACDGRIHLFSIAACSPESLACVLIHLEDHMS